MDLFLLSCLSNDALCTYTKSRLLVQKYSSKIFLEGKLNKLKHQDEQSLRFLLFFAW